MRALSVVIVAFFLAGCSMLGMGEAPAKLEITEYGLFKGGSLVKKTEAVTREMGATFGFRVKVKEVKDAKAGPVKAVITTATPGLLDPSKPKVQLDYVTQATLAPGNTYDVMFTFSAPWEMVAGKWVLKVETEDGESVSKEFEVYNP